MHTPSNWRYIDFRVIPAGSSTPSDDVLHSWNMSAGIETNYAWDCHAFPRPQDVKVPGPGEVRVLRGIQGSASGPATMKTDKAYESVFETEIELRVHELQNLHMNQGHNAAVATENRGAVWAKSVINAGPPQTPKLWDRIDGSDPGTTPTPQADDWWQMIDGIRGGTASFTFADMSRGPIPAEGEGFNYLDAPTAPFGNFGRKWTQLSCMQDGETEDLSINDGGCPSGSDPESPDLLFRRLIRVTIPTAALNEIDPLNVQADEWEFAVRHPLISGASERQCKNGTCPGGSPLPLCTPSLGGGLQADGSVSLAPSIASGSECDGVAGAFGLTAEVNGGPETIVGYAPIGGAHRFRDLLFGVQHTFRTFALAADGRVSAKSAAFSVTPADTTPPAPPIVERVQAISGGVTLAYQTCLEASASLVNVYLSENPGGPYEQANPHPIYVSGPHQVTIPGLANGVTYYGVMTMVDLAGNESGHSPQFSFTPVP